VPDGYRLIEGTVKFEETETHSTPAIGEKGDTFSLTVEGKVTALAVSEEDLSQAIQALIEKNRTDEIEGDFEVSNLNNAEILNVIRDGDKVTFTVVSSGSLQSKVTEEDIKSAIRGKSEKEADDYLLKVEEIESVKIIFSPGFLLDFMRIIPNEDSKIKLVFE
jgi:archaellum component FlaG (FlaF/FlaG flagellin family)